MDTSNLANRMKEYEKRNRYYLQKRTPVAIRVDMRAGHTFTRGFERPFDKIFMETMQETALFMCKNIQNAKFAYIQSDEITIILTDYDTLETQPWFEYRTDKLCSISASMATMTFNKIFKQKVNNYMYEDFTDDINGELELAKSYHKAIEKGAMFDARCFNIPKEEVCNLIYWRQLDATRNSIQMVGQANFSHKELQGKSCNMIQDMLHEQRGINWNDFPTDCKRGAACVKAPIIQNINLMDGTYTKEMTWIIDREMPILKGENRKYIEKFIEEPFS